MPANNRGRKPRDACRYCGADTSLRRDGTIRSHGYTPARGRTGAVVATVEVDCPGTGHPPRDGVDHAT